MTGSALILFIQFQPNRIIFLDAIDLAHQYGFFVVPINNFPATPDECCGRGPVDQKLVNARPSVGSTLAPR